MDDSNPPGFTADPKLQAKLDALDKPEEGEDAKPEVKEEEKPKEAEKDDKATEKTGDEEGTEEEKPAEGDKGADKPDASSKEKEDEGYTIDEGDEEESEPEKPESKTEAASQLTPEQQFILDNVSPIKVRGTVDGGKVQEFEVLAPEQLPQGFKFADDVEMAKATKGFNMLEQRAAQLQQDYRTQETDKAAKEFKQREDTADRQDIAKLQKDGTLPKFKVQPDSKEFDKDPGVKLVQDILDFKDQKNQQYMDEYNSGRPYKHIGFEEAFVMFKRESPQDTAQAKEDAEREKLAKRTSRPAGNGAQEGTQKARVHAGMTSRDLDHLIENLDW